MSGAAGLTYQICWIRTATLQVGSTTVALAAVLAVFFTGLSIGSAAFGQIAVRASRPLRIFGYVECGIAVFALATVPIFRLIGHLPLMEGFGTAVYAVRAAEMAVIALAILPPTILMGAALPCICRYDVRASTLTRGRVAFLYAVNTLGGAFGCAVAGLWLLPEIGVQRSVLAAAALNLTAGLTALAVSRHRAADRYAEPLPERGRWLSLRRPVVVPGALFVLLGASGAASQILWARFAALVVTTTITTYTVTITIVLAGLVIGATIVSRIHERVALVFGLLQVFAAIVVLIVTHLPPAVWRTFDSGVWIYVALFLPASIATGASFPLAVRIVSVDVVRLPADIGWLSALNALGAVVGSMAAATFLPSLGLSTSLYVVTGAGVLAGVISWTRLDRQATRRAMWGLSVASVALWCAIAARMPTRVPADFLTGNGTLLEVKEGRQSNLAVSVLDGRIILTSDNWWQGQDEKSHQIMAAHVPLLLHPDPRSVLMIGVGAGQTPARALMHDIDRLDVVDIELAVFELVRARFDAGWLSDPRVRMKVEDGRRTVARSRQRYDVIAVEAGQLQRPGVAAFYTYDFYAQVHERLTPGGMVSQFVPLAGLDMTAFIGIVRTFTEVFPQAMLWYNRAEPLLVGIKGPAMAIASHRLRDRISSGRIGQDLELALWGGKAQWQRNLPVFLAGFLVGPAGLRQLSSRGEVFRDDRPMLDHLVATRADAVNDEAIPLAIDARRESIRVLDAEIDASAAERISMVQRQNVGDMRALALARRAAGRTGVSQLLRAVNANPVNVQILAALGVAYLRAGRVSDSLDALRRAERIDEEDPRVQRDLGTVLWQMQRRGEAVAHFRRAVEGLPLDAESHYYLGAALKVIGDNEEAAVLLRRALELRPDYALAQSLMSPVP